MRSARGVRTVPGLCWAPFSPVSRELAGLSCVGVCVLVQELAALDCFTGLLGRISTYISQKKGSAPAHSWQLPNSCTEGHAPLSLGPGLKHWESRRSHTRNPSSATGLKSLPLCQSPLPRCKAPGALRGCPAQGCHCGWWTVPCLEERKAQAANMRGGWRASVSQAVGRARHGAAGLGHRARAARSGGDRQGQGGSSAPTLAVALAATSFYCRRHVYCWPELRTSASGVLPTLTLRSEGCSGAPSQTTSTTSLGTLPPR